MLKFVHVGVNLTIEFTTMLKKLSAVFCLLTLFVIQVSAASQMEETMFQSGKIYTFLTVALVVLAGIFFYLLRLDRRLGKLENEIKDK